MSNTDIITKNRLILFARFLLLLLLLIPSISHGEPIAVNGVLDLRSDKTHLVERGLVLRGEWEFYWQQLLTSESFKKKHSKLKKEIVNFPSPWNKHHIKKQKLPEDGYATYRLTILSNEENHLLSLKLPYMGTAYRLYVNGKEVSSNGVVGQNKENSQPEWRPSIATFSAEKQLEIILQISNFHYTKGGIWRDITFGTEAVIREKKEMKIAYDLLMFGAIFIMALYHLCQFLIRKKESTSLLFGLLCLFLSIRVLLVNERFVTYLFEDLHWELMTKINQLTTYLAFTMVILFLKAFFPHSFSKKFISVVQGSCILFSSIALLTSAKIHTHSLALFHLLTIASFFYISWRLFVAIKDNEEYALIFFIGVLTIEILTIHDIFHDFGFIQTGYYFSIGLLYFIFSQSVVISMRALEAFQKKEELSEELLDKSFALEANNKELSKHEEELLKKNEQLSELDRLKDEFLANTSHELRTPLHAIIGTAESITQKKNTEEVHSGMELIINSGRRLSYLINDILDFSKLKNNELRLNPKPVDIKEVTKIVLLNLNTLTEKKELSIHCDFPKNLPLLHVDEIRLQQILFNLIGNAIKFTNEGSVTISATTMENYLTISVSDTGIGIPKERLNQIFEPFTQANTTKEQSQGAGLGLSITKKLIELHRGKITVTSDSNRGSTFSFTLPRSKQAEVKRTETDQKREESTRWEHWTETVDQEKQEQELATTLQQQKLVNRLDRKTILVVDDELTNLKIIAHQLINDGFYVITAKNGIEAIEKMETELPDLILLDIVMPRMNGFEFCQKVRKKYDINTLPIIMLTAKGQPEDMEKGFQLGANDFLIKPHHTRELKSRIISQINAKESHERLIDIKQLKQKIQDYQQTEKELEASQEQLQELLNLIDEPILSFNKQHQITYINKGLEDLIGKKKESVIHEKIETYFPDIYKQIEDFSNITNWDSQKFQALSQNNAVLQIINVSGKGSLSAKVSNLTTTGQEITIIFNRKKMITPPNFPLLRRKPIKRSDHLRPLLVELLNKSVEYWINQQTTEQNKNRAAFAMESQLWKIQNDGGTLRTRTLDNYMDIATLPKYPKVNNIFDSATFVKEQYNLPERQIKELNRIINEIKSIVP